MSAKGDPGEARRGRRVRFDRSQGEKAMPVPRPVRTGQRARGGWPSVRDGGGAGVNRPKVIGVAALAGAVANLPLSYFLTLRLGASPGWSGGRC